jgi:glycosyltransferase involved in cell wall biosynthesis
VLFLPDKFLDRTALVRINVNNDRAMTESPIVSLVTPSYNQADFLERTILSVLEQTHAPIEYIVIDGGSTDGSLDIIRKYRDRLAYWVSEPDRGQADAINKGFARATGKYLGWLNSDDVLYPGAVARTVGFLEAHPEVDFVYGDVDQGESEGATTPFRGKATTFETMLATFEVPVPQQGSLWRRSLLDRVGPLDPRWQVVLDREFFLRAAEHCNMAYLPETLGFFRMHPESKSVALQTRWLDELPVLYEDYFARPGTAVAALRAQGLGCMYLQCAWLACKHGLYGRACGFLSRALARDPWLPFRKGPRVMVKRYLSR